MVIQNKCCNTCFYLHYRFRMRTLFLVRHDTLSRLSVTCNGRSLSIYESECQIWKTFTAMFTTDIASIHGRLISMWKFECMKSSFCPTFCLQVTISRALASFLKYPYLEMSVVNIAVKVFHIWHSDSYMDRLRPYIKLFLNIFIFHPR
jgi:hypothetical protein